VVGYDARTDSDLFARDTCEVTAGAGIPAMVLPHPLPTPVLAFAVRWLACGAGVMVTASHNPAADNGYKVYDSSGSQIVPPSDAEISALIDAAPAANALARNAEDWDTLGDDVLDAYLSRATSTLLPGARTLTWAYTPMHGVGGAVMLAAAERAGFPAAAVVAQQAEPDRTFPTVAFPNPEEPGALDLGLELARSVNADVLIAHDPDADRCSVAVPTPNGWRALSGDELGSILGWWTIVRAHRAGEPLAGVFANSIVSSTLLERIATDAGLSYQATLTGFKYIGRLPGLLFGYEEALGYCVDPGGVADKDGITAALRVLELVAVLKDERRTLLDILDDLARTYGVYATKQLSLRFDDLSLIGVVLDRLIAAPPTSLAGVAVSSVENLDDGVGGLLPTPGLRFWLTDGSRIVVRPSGTEPKLKAYLLVVEQMTTNLGAARAEADARLEALAHAVSELLDV
jgi:phosphomannomutase